MKLHPDIGVVLNIDFDHPDCYKSLKDTYLAFTMFMAQSKAVVYNSELDFNDSERLKMATLNLCHTEQTSLRFWTTNCETKQLYQI